MFAKALEVQNGKFVWNAAWRVTLEARGIGSRLQKRLDHGGAEGGDGGSRQSVDARTYRV